MGLRPGYGLCHNSAGLCGTVRGVDPLITSLMTVWCLMYGRVRGQLNISTAHLTLVVLDIDLLQTVLGGLWFVGYLAAVCL